MPLLSYTSLDEVVTTRTPQHVHGDVAIAARRTAALSVTGSEEVYLHHGACPDHRKARSNTILYNMV